MAIVGRADDGATLQGVAYAVHKHTESKHAKELEQVRAEAYQQGLQHGSASPMHGSSGHGHAEATSKKDKKKLKKEAKKAKKAAKKAKKGGSSSSSSDSSDSD